MRFLALKTRGWTLASDDGYGYSSAMRELGAGRRVLLGIHPGVDLYEVRNAPAQTLADLRVMEGSGQLDWARLDDVAFSEIMREVVYLAL
jgi:hypothetical protein